MKSVLWGLVLSASLPVFAQIPTAERHRIAQHTQAVARRFQAGGAPALAARGGAADAASTVTLQGWRLEAQGFVGDYYVEIQASDTLAHALLRDQNQRALIAVEKAQKQRKPAISAATLQRFIQQQTHPLAPDESVHVAIYDKKGQPIATAQSVTSDFQRASVHIQNLRREIRGEVVLEFTAVPLNPKEPAETIRLSYRHDGKIPALEIFIPARKLQFSGTPTSTSQGAENLPATDALLSLQVW